MPDVEFSEEEAERAALASFEARTSRTAARGLAGVLIRMGLAKDERSASSVLLIVAGVAVAAALVIFLIAGP